MSLQRYIDGLQIPSSEPVSFDLHCEIGRIIEQDTEKITELEQTVKILLDPEEIIFIP